MSKGFLYENISIAGSLNLKFSSISIEDYIPRFLNVNRGVSLFVFLNRCIF